MIALSKWPYLVRPIAVVLWLAPVDSVADHVGGVDWRKPRDLEELLRERDLGDGARHQVTNCKKKLVVEM